MDTSDYDLITRHPHSIIHLDMDCFYAQVEMLRHPEHDGKPLGVQQKSMVVTSNYSARRFGVKKLMSVQEARRLCPELALVRGEDLTEYRRYSAKIAEILHQFTPLVERGGLDESYIDVSSLVERSLYARRDSDCGMTAPDEEPSGGAEGEVFGPAEEDCPCGCHARLAAASRIAAEMRRRIFKELRLTCSAGISHNKLLAKLAGGLHKPNGQTVVYPCAGAALLASIGPVSKIPGVGQKTAELLMNNHISTVEDLRRIPVQNLELKIGTDLARKLKDTAEGIDESVVKPSGKPQSIGIEDGFRSVSLVAEVESRLGALLRRLTELATEDGRIPVAMKITVRKHEFNKPGTGKRETRQCALPQSSLPATKGGAFDHAKMLSLAMKLFHRAVDVSKPFHLTLLGVAFTKFEERTCGRSSITSFLRKQVAVQSVLDISSEEGIADASLGSPMSVNQDSNDAPEQSQPMTLANSSSCGMESPSISRSNGPAAQYTDEEDVQNEVEPSPKKTKLEVWLSGRRESPSNEMAGLRLGPSSPISPPPGTDAAVFKALPLHLQREVSHSWPATSSKPKPNDILKYFIANK